MTGLPSPDRSRVVIIGCSEYDHLSDLPAVRNNVDALARVVRDPLLWGISVENCTIVSEDPRGGAVSAANVIEAVRRAAEEVGRDGLLLIYYAGHGLIDESSGHLYLAVTGSEQGEEDAGAVAYDSIRRRVLRSRAAHKMVVLDCCYAGRALLGEMSGAGLAEDIEIERSVIMAATNRNLVALAPLGARHTAFTGELLSVLNDGVAGGPLVLDAQTIWLEILRAQTAKGLPRPEFRSRNAAGDLPLIRNAWFARAEERRTEERRTEVRRTEVRRTEVRRAVAQRGAEPGRARTPGLPPEPRRTRAATLAGVAAVVSVSLVLLWWGPFDRTERSAAPTPTAATGSPSAAGALVTVTASRAKTPHHAATTRPSSAVQAQDARDPIDAAKDTGTTDPDPAESAQDPEPGRPAEIMCTDSEMSVSVDPDSTEVKRGQPLELYLQVMNVGTRTCTRDTSAAPTEVYLADGPRMYWSTDTCSLDREDVKTEFGPGSGQRIKVIWNGRQSTSCAGGEPAGPYPPAGSFELRGRVATMVSQPVTVTIVAPRQ